jgi:hypothetical protein
MAFIRSMLMGIREMEVAARLLRKGLPSIERRGLVFLGRGGRGAVIGRRVFLGGASPALIFRFSLLVHFALPFLKRVWILSHGVSISV